MGAVRGLPQEPRRGHPQGAENCGGQGPGGSWEGQDPEMGLPSVPSLPPPVVLLPSRTGTRVCFFGSLWGAAQSVQVPPSPRLLGPPARRRAQGPAGELAALPAAPRTDCRTQGAQLTLRSRKPTLSPLRLACWDPSQPKPEAGSGQCPKTPRASKGLTKRQREPFLSVKRRVCKRGGPESGGGGAAALHPRVSGCEVSESASGS